MWPSQDFLASQGSGEAVRDQVSLDDVGWVPLHLARAMSAYSGISSKPKYLRRPSIAATAVVPVPTNGSNTSSPGAESSLITRLGNSLGNCASCSTFARTDGIFQTAREPQSLHSAFSSRFRSTCVIPGFQKM
jgi:hypothetical protein